MEYEIIKPKIEYLDRVREILIEWTDREEADKYVKRIQNEIIGKTEFGMSFWLIKNKNIVVGVGGLSDIMPSLKSLAQTKNPGELKILYLDNQYRGKGLGKIFLDFLEKEAKGDNKTELIIRSAERYKDTAYPFYLKMGYKKVGITDNNMAVFNKKI